MHTRAHNRFPVMPTELSAEFQNVTRVTDRNNSELIPIVQTSESDPQLHLIVYCQDASYLTVVHGSCLAVRVAGLWRLWEEGFDDLAHEERARASLGARARAGAGADEGNRKREQENIDVWFVVE